MATEIRAAGNLGLNTIFYALSTVGDAVLTVAVGTLNPSGRTSVLFGSDLSDYFTPRDTSSEGSKVVGSITKDVVTTVVDKTAGEASVPSVFVRSSLEATGAVGSIVLDVADAGVRGAGQVGQLVAATAISTVGGVATDAVVATGTAVSKAVFDTVGTVASKASSVASKE